MKLKLVIYLFLIVLGAVLAIGGVWVSAYTIHVLEDWGTVPSIITGIITLVGGILIICYASNVVYEIAKDMKCHE